jgi:glycogen(starch) synthase
VGSDEAEERLTPLRLCILSEEYPPITAYWGGIGTQYGRLAPALADLGHEVHVVSIRPPSGEVPTELDGVHIHALPRGRAWPWYPLARARRVERALRGLGRFDAILTPEFRAEGSLYSRRQSNGPLITHVLTSSEQLLAIRPGLTALERHGPRTRITLALERQQTERSAALLAPGRAVLDWARELWPGIADRPADIVPLSLDIAAVRRHGAGPPPDGFPRDGPTVTLASRLDGHKGAQQLVQAMHQVWRSRPETRLVFVGRDARYGRRRMSEYLLELAGERADRVHVLGGQPPERYFAAVAASDIVTIPSLWESFCLAGLEALALGRPFVATRGHGFDEFVEEGVNGLLVERCAVDELADALGRLLDDAELRGRLGAAAAETADRHDVAALAPRYAGALGRFSSGALSASKIS